MRTLNVFVAIALTLGMAGVASADGIPQVVSASDNANWTRVVYNDSGATLTSGMVVVWDNDDTEFDRSGYPYVTTTTTEDDDWVAGVVKDSTCPVASMCEIVVYGPVMTNMADSTDASAEDTTVATSTVAGQAGDWGAGGNTCYLGLLMEDQGSDAEDEERDMVFVDPGCED